MRISTLTLRRDFKIIKITEITIGKTIVKMTHTDMKIANITNGTIEIIENMTMIIGKIIQIMIMDKHIINNRDKTNHNITSKTIDRIKDIITKDIMDQTTTKDKLKIIIIIKGINKIVVNTKTNGKISPIQIILIREGISKSIKKNQIVGK